MKIASLFLIPLIAVVVASLFFWSVLPEKGRFTTSAAGQRDLEDLFDEIFIKNSLSGGVLVSQNGHIQLEKSYGWADQKQKILNHPHTQFNSCYLHHQDKILLLHRQDYKAEGNRWGIPGGKLNNGEDLLNLVMREVFEETGLLLDKEKLHYIGKLYISVQNFDFEYHMVDYLEPIKNPGDVKINFKEHKGFTWVTPKDALKMDLITDEATCFSIVFGL